MGSNKSSKNVSVAWSRLGYGGSDGWPDSDGPYHDDQAAAIASLIVAECSEPVHVVGHSFGGAVATRFVLAEPGAVRRLVLIEPVLTPLLNLAGRNDVFAEYEKLARYFIENVGNGRETDHTNGGSNSYGTHSCFTSCRSK